MIAEILRVREGDTEYAYESTRILYVPKISWPAFDLGRSLGLRPLARTRRPLLARSRTPPPSPRVSPAMTSLAPLAVVASVAPASTTRARVAVARPARAMVTSTPRAKISVSSSSSSRRARVVAASSSSSPSDASASSDAADANAASAQLWIDAWREKNEKRVAKAARKEDEARAKEAETILREQLDAAEKAATTTEEIAEVAAAKAAMELAKADAKAERKAEKKARTMEEEEAMTDETRRAREEEKTAKKLAKAARKAAELDAMSPEDRALEEEKMAAKAEKKKLKAERKAAEAMMTEVERAEAKARRELAKAEAKAAEKAAERSKEKEKEKEKETTGAKAKEETKEETKEVDHRVLKALMDIDMEMASGRSMDDSADDSADEEDEEEEAFEAVAPAAAPASSSAESVKSQLMDAVAGTKRGLAASGAARARINELIATLEASNPTPSPATADGAAGLAGEWKIAYTSASELLLLLASENLPGVTIGDITQTIDVVAGTVENRVNVRAPLIDTSLIATADFEATSPKRIRVKFTDAGVVTPSIDTSSVLQYIDLPPTIDVAGQSIDTTAASEALEPLRKAAEGALGGLAEAVKTLPPALKVPLPAGGLGAAGAEGAESTWLLTTYLDEDTRVARGDGGSVFVMRRAKEVASAAR